MSKKTRVLDRLGSEFESGSASISELTRKYSVTEGMVFEHLQGKGIAKVRRDCWGRVLDRIREWGRITIRVRNDGAVVQVSMSSDRLRRQDRHLVAEQGEAHVSVLLSGIATIYFLEDIPSMEPTVSFINKRGRSIFEVCVPRLEDNLLRFKQARDTTCVGYLEGPIPTEEIRL